MLSSWAWCRDYAARARSGPISPGPSGGDAAARNRIAGLAGSAKGHCPVPARRVPVTAGPPLRYPHSTRSESRRTVDRDGRCGAGPGGGRDPNAWTAKGDGLGPPESASFTPKPAPPVRRWAKALPLRSPASGRTSTTEPLRCASRI